MAVGPDSKIASVLNGYVGCEVVDDYTIRIEIESYNNEFVASLSSVPLSIQSKKAWERAAWMSLVHRHRPVQVRVLGRGRLLPRRQG